MSYIPSEEEFARAKRVMREESRNLDRVADNVERHFSSRCRLHMVYILPQRDVDFRIYIFFNTDNDLVISKQRGLTEEISTFVREELERAGRGQKESLKLAFEFDSDENVIRRFHGDYFDRLR